MAKVRCGNLLASAFMAEGFEVSFEPRWNGERLAWRVNCQSQTAKQAKRLLNAAWLAAFEFVRENSYGSHEFCPRPDAISLARRAIREMASGQVEDEIGKLIDDNHGNCPMCGYDSCGCRCGFCG